MSIVESLTSLITPQILGSLSSRLGESEGAVQKGLTSGAATLLGSLAGRATDSGFLTQIFGLITSGNNANLLGSLAGLASGNANSAVSGIGGQLLSMVLGSNQSAITNAIGQAAGLKGSSAATLLSLAAPMVLGVLGKKASTEGLTASSLGSMLTKEASSFQGLMPAGIGSLLGGMSGLGSAASGAIGSVADEAASAGNKWLVPGIIGALLLGGLYYFMNMEKPAVPEVNTKAIETAANKATETASTAATSVGNMANAAWAALGEFFKRKLPNGIELNIPKLGVENQLIDFVEDAAKPVDKTTWFDFDRLLFDTAKATLQPASQEQLDNVANILKAFPNVNIKIGGYTDNVGVAAANKKLSDERAKSVMAELVKLGIDAKRLSAEGYGDQHPVADNATDEGRAKNRRVSMRVTKK